MAPRAPCCSQLNPQGIVYSDYSAIMMLLHGQTGEQYAQNKLVLFFSERQNKALKENTPFLAAFGKVEQKLL